MANTAPTEVLEQICQHLPTSGLKKARLLCRSFESVARRDLFSEVLFRTNLSSLRKLSWISRHPTLKHFVKRLLYDVRLLERRYHNMEDWLKRNAGVDGYKGADRIAVGSECEMPIEPSGSALLPAENAYHYSQYRYHVDCQKRILAENHLYEWLAAACILLPNLVTMEIASCDQDSSSKKQTPSVIGRETLVEPAAIPSSEEREYMLTSLLKAAKASKTLLRSFSGEVPIRSFTALAFSGHLFDEVLGKLRHLHLDIEYAAADHGIFRWLDNCAGFLAQASMLQTMHLVFNVPLSGHMALLEPLLRVRGHWPSLKNLKLGGLRCKDGLLRDFLFTHTSTLSTLEMNDIKLYNKPGVPNSAGCYWIDFIEFLAQSMQLKYIRLDGRLVGPLELWITHDKEYYRAYYGDDPAYKAELRVENLRNKIEMFIISGGECPLKRADRNDKGFPDGYGDWSWKHSSQRLPCDHEF